MLHAGFYRFRFAAPALLVGFLASVVDCASAPPAPRMRADPSCPAGRALPHCAAPGEFSSVSKLVTAGVAPNTVVQVEGRLVPGARCCDNTCPPHCVVQLALVDATEPALTPSSGPLLLLTVADRYGWGFSEQNYAKPPITCDLRSNVEGRPATYCCDADVSGQLVRVSGRVVPVAHVTTLEPGCKKQEPEMALMATECQLSASWRSDWSQARAITVDEWCAVEPE